MHGIAGDRLMSRISVQALARAIQKVRAMNLGQKEQLADAIYLAQPNLLATVLVQKQLGVSLEKMEFLIDILLVCFQAMKESGIAWPLITEDEQDKQMTRYIAAVKFGEDLSAPLRDLAFKQYIESHPEQQLLAFVTGEINDWLSRIPPESNDKYIMLAATNFVNCIAFVPLPAPLPTRQSKQK
ncbi:MAG TPA: hypothetical protein VNX00_09685 [Herbaspirillum sp.]|nr:hypothetical protein [Herbaspirillum sp.]